MSYLLTKYAFGRNKFLSGGEVLRPNLNEGHCV